MPKVFTSKNQKIGKVGEDIISKFLMKRGYEIIERNHTRPWGEIDIVAKKSGILHFIEVKSVSDNSHSRGNLHDKNIHRQSDEYTPEDNMHSWKRKRLKRVIQTYLSFHDPNGKAEWQIDLYVVFIDFKTKKAEIKVVKDIIL